jgi:hypothetical protein
MAAEPINGDSDWEEADDTPAETRFIGWPAKPPTSPNPLVVEVTEEHDDATDASDKPCPEYEVLLLQDFINYRNGEPVPAAAGETKVLTCGQWILRDRIEQLKPKVGDQLKIIFDRMSGRAKHFVVRIRRKGIDYSDLEVD